MTHPGMCFRAFSRVVLPLLALSTLTGCSTFHGWAQASSGRASTAGASVSLPFGK